MLDTDAIEPTDTDLPDDTGPTADAGRAGE